MRQFRALGARCAAALTGLLLLWGCASTAPAPASVPAASPVPPVVAPPADDVALRERFAAWVAAFRQKAAAAGIVEATLDAAFADVQYLPRVVERDRSQPEFTRAPWDYLETAVSAQRVAQGQRKAEQVRAEAMAAQQRYGVPPATLLAIWGIESNYGGNTGDIRTIDALATLAFDGRRAAWAQGELLAALKILQAGDIEVQRMRGSWAGAMGQTQFLPSNFLAYAVDADGDGRRDIWNSAADVLASTANFLSRIGWRSGEAWGCEVKLPPGYDLARADGARRQGAAQWAAEGLQTMDGAPLPEVADATVWLPAGARGPAFLTGANFRALLRYNNSNSYALAVSLLAQRIDGGPDVQAPWPRELTPLTRAQMLELQTELSRHGFDAGVLDGVLGPATRAGLRQYQRSVGLPADGYPTLDLLQRLRPD